MTKSHRPKDPNPLAKLIVDIAMGKAENEKPEETKKPCRRCVGTLKTLKRFKRGKARASNLAPDQPEIVQKLATKTV